MKNTSVNSEFKISEVYVTFEDKFIFYSTFESKYSLNTKNSLNSFIVIK